MTTIYDQSHDDTIAEMSAEGAAPVVIADTLNARYGLKTTPSAVIGRRWRMGLGDEKDDAESARSRIVRSDYAYSLAVCRHHPEIAEQAGFRLSRHPVGRSILKPFREQRRRKAEKRAQEAARKRLKRARQEAAEKAELERKQRLAQSLVMAELRDLIVREICAAHDIPKAVLTGNARDWATARIRFEAYHRLYNEAGMSMTQIGRFFNRDHTTVLHGMRRYQEMQAG